MDLEFQGIALFQEENHKLIIQLKDHIGESSTNIDNLGKANSQRSLITMMQSSVFASRIKK